jgi:hypothetical protein
MNEYEQFCEDCKHWDFIDQEGIPEYGKCRRFPPVIKGSRNLNDQFSVTVKSDWCGEWQERDDD